MSSHLKELWEEWELRALVLLSLAIQVLLIFLGLHRKYRVDVWLRMLLWLCYLVADLTAIYALGMITTQLKQMQHETAKGLNPNAQMAGFWAPFLLLHLGGPDTITAYALEDNELWLRHCITFAIQTTMMLYIFFQMLTGSDLWALSLLMITSGFIKCAERVYVLWAASSNQFRDSIPDPLLHPSKILEEYKLKKAEGYDITMHEVTHVWKVSVPDKSNVDKDLSSPDEDLLSNELKGKLKQGEETSNCGQSLLATSRDILDLFRRLFGDKNLLPKAMSERNRVELAVACDLINIFQRFFADLVLTFQDRDSSLSMLRDKHFHVVFRIIEIELGLMFDLLYTKAMVIYNRWGFALRIMSIVFTVTVLVLFSLLGKDNYSKIDVYVTFSLLSVAIFLEIYALFVLLISDEAACWLINHGPAILDFVERLKPLYNRRRWMGSMPQYNVISFALKEKHLTCPRILKFLHVNQVVLKCLCKGEVKVSDLLKERVLQYVKLRATSEKEALAAHQYDLELRKYGLLDFFKSSIELEFDQRILVWHITTELLCHPRGRAKNSETSKQLSRYMLYLLVEHPFLLPIGVARVKFRDTYTEVMSVLNERRSRKLDRLGTLLDDESGFDIATSACIALREDVNTQLDPMVTKGDKRKFILHEGCRLAWWLDKITDQEMKWNIISYVWLDMLAYAAIKCRGLQHARQLQQGGQFLTHVWLLMAHFGLTDHFKISHDPAIAELLVRQDSQ